MTTEKNIKGIKTLGSVTGIISKIISICCFVAFCIMLVTSVILFIVPEDIMKVTNETVSSVEVMGVSDILSESMLENGEIAVEMGEDNVVFADFGATANGVITKNVINAHDLASGMLAMAFSSLAYAVVFYYAARFGKALRANETPFCAQCTSLLSKTGIAVLVCAVLSFFLVDIIALASFGASASSSGIGLIVIGIFVFILSKVYKYGTQLQQQADETL